MIRGAYISECGLYRYTLTRRWGEGKALGWIMLNPSTADALVDDPTIRRCIGFAQRLGFEAIQVENLFAYRATNPRTLSTVADPVGPENDVRIGDLVMSCSMTIAAWGNHGTLLQRAEKVVKLLRGRPALYALKVSNIGHPCHPLYLPKNRVPEVWR